MWEPRHRLRRSAHIQIRHIKFFPVAGQKLKGYVIRSRRGGVSHAAAGICAFRNGVGLRWYSWRVAIFQPLHYGPNRYTDECPDYEKEYQSENNRKRWLKKAEWHECTLSRLHYTRFALPVIPTIWFIFLWAAVSNVCLGVDFESLNPSGSGFRLKHFTAYTHSVVRRIDEYAVSKWEAAP